MYSAFGRGDVPFILSHLASGVSWEFEAPAILSFGGIHHGPVEAARFFEGIVKDHADPELQIETYVVQGEHVATFGRYSATLKTTGHRVSTPLAHFWTFANGKVTRFVNYINTAAFVEAMQP